MKVQWRGEVRFDRYIALGLIGISDERSRERVSPRQDIDDKIAAIGICHSAESRAFHDHIGAGKRIALIVFDDASDFTRGARMEVGGKTQKDAYHSDSFHLRLSLLIEVEFDTRTDIDEVKGICFFYAPNEKGTQFSHYDIVARAHI